MKRSVLFCVIASLLLISCRKIDSGSDPNFKIVKNNDSGTKKANRKVDVFGIPVYALKDVSDVKLLHAANILAQFLDNDEDGVVDNPLIVETIIEEQSGIFLWSNESDAGKISLQDLGDEETMPVWHTNGHIGRFDAALEEVWHVVTHSGYSKAYPNVFGESAGTSIANSMDVARGGQFTSIPSSYPAASWYSYTDATCMYDCQVTEYFYWAMLSILGAQENRLDEIQHEWKLNTKLLVEEQDSTVYSLLTDPQYKFPTVLPDGTYRH
ncbi:MAG: hypothetical protein ACJAUR_000105 [Ulvibacter sp.]|jgi:hypothetical protein